jgi:hypothetical protein
VIGADAALVVAESHIHDPVQAVLDHPMGSPSSPSEREQVGAPSDQPFLNRRAEAFVGRVFTLEKPIVDGTGTVGIDDTVWRVSGPDTPAGSRVKVIRVDGAALYVEPAGA